MNIEFILSKTQMIELKENNELFLECPNNKNHNLNSGMCIHCLNYNNFKISKNENDFIIELIKNDGIKQYNLLMREILTGQRLL